MLIWTVGTIVSLFTPSVWASVSATKKGLTAGGLAKELADLAVYGSTRAVIVRNHANTWLRVWCASKDDNIGEQRLNPGESFGFAFKPKVIGGYTVFWCTADYKGYWARWDVFGGDAEYGFKNKNDKSYVYEIRDDGVYYKERKIRGLAAGKHKYVLWEHYDKNKNPYGTSLTGFVGGYMCNNIPGFMAKKTSDVTLCDNSCVTLYSDLHCRGQTSKLQASSGGCMNFYLTYFNDRTMSVEGC